MFRKSGRFGEEMVIPLKPNKNGYPQGYFEISGRLYRISLTEGKDGNKAGARFWATLRPARKSSSSMGSNRSSAF